MFENVPSKPREAEPEDMFKDAESPQQAMVPPVPPSPSVQGVRTTVPSPIAESETTVPASASYVPPPPSARSFPWKSLLIGLGMLVVVVGVSITAYFFLSAGQADWSPAQGEPTPTPDYVDPISGESFTVLETDSDKDGLTDARESALGTNPFSVDTDGDQLFDREEVEVYRTGPLNPDTDGDSYLDGVEVSGGYDPNGPGRLLSVPVSN